MSQAAPSNKTAVSPELCPALSGQATPVDGGLSPVTPMDSLNSGVKAMVLTKKYVAPHGRDGFKSATGNEPAASIHEPAALIHRSSRDSLSSGSSKSSKRRSHLDQPWRATSSAGSETRSTHSESYDADLDGPDVDFQTVYSSDCVVFVANLASGQSEANLEVLVQEVFRQFGKCQTKVRRDDKNMPFAFVTYTNTVDATAAIRYGSDLPVGGRACRTEKARCPRMYLIDTKYGPSITKEEAAEVLRPYGELAKCYVIEDIQRERYGLGHGVVVEFQSYTAGQQAQAGLRRSQQYKLTTINQSAASRALTPRRDQGAVNTQMLRHSASRHLEDCSVHVGNLPTSITREQVAQHFSQCGSVVKVTMNTSQSTYNAGTYTFAFVEYVNIVSAERAVDSLNNTTLLGNVIKVSAKDSAAHGRQSMTPLRRTVAGPASAPAAPVQQVFQGSLGSPYAPQHFVVPQVPATTGNYLYMVDPSTGFSCPVPSPPVPAYQYYHGSMNYGPLQQPGGYYQPAPPQWSLPVNSQPANWNITQTPLTSGTVGDLEAGRLTPVASYPHEKADIKRPVEPTSGDDQVTPTPSRAVLASLGDSDLTSQ